MIWKFSLNTEKIKIKWNIKSWVLGYSFYYISPSVLSSDKTQDKRYLRQLQLVLLSLPFLGMGSGVKLGLGNVKAFR